MESKADVGDDRIGCGGNHCDVADAAGMCDVDRSAVRGDNDIGQREASPEVLERSTVLGGHRLGQVLPGPDA